MLSIRASISPEYLLSQVVTNYHFVGGEPAGYFLGGAKEALGLPDKAVRELVEKLFAGFAPDGRKLVKNAGISRAESERGRRPAWDCTYSAPKSVSVLWGMLPDTPLGRKYRRIIAECCRQSVAYAVRYLEHEAAKTRRGKDGTKIEPVKLIAAAYEHGTSRANEIQWHQHVMVFNLGLREDGSFGSLHSPFLYKHKVAAGVAFSSRLAFLLQQAGLKIERDQHNFRIVGVPEKVCDANSTRRKQVKAELKRLGLSSAKAAQFATLETRPAKTHISRKELFRKTREIGSKLAFTADDAVALFREGRPTGQTISQSHLRDAVQAAIDLLVKSEAFFAKHEVVRLVLKQFQGANLDPDQVLAAVNQKLQRGRDIVHLHKYNGIQQYSTTEILAPEAQMLVGLDKLNVSASHGVDPLFVQQQLAKHPSLSEEQKRAAEHLLAAGQFKAVTGLPGTGKTYVLGICKEIWRAAGYHVQGVCLAGRAAVNLQEEAGIRSDTVARFLRHLEQTRFEVLAEYGKAFVRTIRLKPTIPIKRLKLSPKSVLVLDEAGMIDTHHFDRIRRHVERHGAKLVATGDDFQLPPIGAGSPFSAAIERVGAVKMVEIRRQKDVEDRKAINALLANDTGQFLESVQARGRLHVLDCRPDAMDKLIADWTKNLGHLRPDDHRIIVTTNAERHRINERCQRQRIGLRGMAVEPRVKVGDSRIYLGDFVTFTKRNTRLGIENGQTGFVTSIDRSARQAIKVTVTTAARKQVTCNLKHYKAIELAYASTTHRLQGGTVKVNTYTMLSESQGNSMTYTQFSRHVEEGHIYTDKVSAGENLEHLASQIGRPERKLLAHDLLEKDIEQTRPNVGRFTPPPEHSPKAKRQRIDRKPVARADAPAAPKPQPKPRQILRPPLPQSSVVPTPEPTPTPAARKQRLSLRKKVRETERQLQDLSELVYPAKVVKPLRALVDQMPRPAVPAADATVPIEPPKPRQWISLSPKLQ